MKLRKYIKEDSAIICSWIQDERAYINGQQTG